MWTFLNPSVNFWNILLSKVYIMIWTPSPLHVRPRGLWHWLLVTNFFSGKKYECWRLSYINCMYFNEIKISITLKFKKIYWCWTKCQLMFFLHHLLFYSEICNCTWPAPRILAGTLLFHNKNTVLVSPSYPAWTLATVSFIMKKIHLSGSVKFLFWVK